MHVKNKELKKPKSLLVIIVCPGIFLEYLYLTSTSINCQQKLSFLILNILWKRKYNLKVKRWQVVGENISLVVLDTDSVNVLSLRETLNHCFL